MARSVCLKPVSMETWRLRTLQHFTVPAYCAGCQSKHLVVSYFVSFYVDSLLKSNIRIHIVTVTHFVVII